MVESAPLACTVRTNRIPGESKLSYLIHANKGRSAPIALVTTSFTMESPPSLSVSLFRHGLRRRRPRRPKDWTQ